MNDCIHLIATVFTSFGAIQSEFKIFIVRNYYTALLRIALIFLYQIKKKKKGTILSISKLYNIIKSFEDYYTVLVFFLIVL